MRCDSMRSKQVTWASVSHHAVCPECAAFVQSAPAVAVSALMAGAVLEVSRMMMVIKDTPEINLKRELTCSGIRPCFDFSSSFRFLPACLRSSSHSYIVSQDTDSKEVSVVEKKLDTEHDYTGIPHLIPRSPPYHRITAHCRPVRPHRHASLPETLRPQGQGRCLLIPSRGFSLFPDLLRAKLLRSRALSA